MKEKFYLTTAIAYTSGKPHIGNTYEIVLADAIARFKRLQGYDVYFQTGTDEHGIKIEEKANSAGISPKEFVDGIAAQIQSIWDLMNTSYDKFVRTTDSSHEKIVQHIFRKMYENGDIYKIDYFAGVIVDGMDNRNIYASDFIDESQFNAYFDNIVSNSTFQSDCKVEFGDKIVVFQTCSYEYNRATFLLYGRLTKVLINDQEVQNTLGR